MGGKGAENCLCVLGSGLSFQQGIPVELLPALGEERPQPSETSTALERLRDIATQLAQLTPANLLVLVCLSVVFSIIY